MLVVGAGASGAQIAEELMRAGRQVFFSVGKHKRAPRRYRGHDHVWWWIETGMDQTPPERRPADRSPIVHTGAYGGYTMDFRDFARQGMVQLGRALMACDGVMSFAPDLLIAQMAAFFESALRDQVLRFDRAARSHTVCPWFPPLVRAEPDPTNGRRSRSRDRGPVRERHWIRVRLRGRMRRIPRESRRLGSRPYRRR